MGRTAENLTPAALAKYFDHTMLKPNAARADFEAVCADSRRYGFKMVAVNPSGIALCKELLAGSGVLAGAGVGFPLGQNTIETKVFETRDAIENGSDEIDYVINITRLKERDYAYVEREMAEIVAVCRERGVTSKVIFENCYLTDDEKQELCRIAVNVKPDFIKTSTGFGTGGATLPDVELMLRCVGGSGVKVKAAGGVRTLETALSLIERGVERIGSTSSVAILNAFMEGAR